MKNSEIARVFSDIADLLELKGENQFKIRAYQKAVRSIEYLPVEMEQLVNENRLKEVPGVGEAIAKKITELVTTGRLEYYEKLRAEFPEGISTLLDIPGVGPKIAMLLSSELEVDPGNHLAPGILLRSSMISSYGLDTLISANSHMAAQKSGIFSIGHW